MRDSGLSIVYKTGWITASGVKTEQQAICAFVPMVNRLCICMPATTFPATTTEEKKQKKKNLLPAGYLHACPCLLLPIWFKRKTSPLSHSPFPACSCPYTYHLPCLPYLCLALWRTMPACLPCLGMPGLLHACHRPAFPNNTCMLLLLLLPVPACLSIVFL